MRVIITGGIGFLGQKLAAALLERGELCGPSGTREPIEKVVLFDAVAPPASPFADERVEVRVGDLCDRAAVEGAVGKGPASIFHLASMLSSACEKDLDLAMRVNVDGMRNIIGACAASGGRPRLVFASSIAVFGGRVMPSEVGDDTKQTPRTTYGVTKAACEMLVNDASRKGVVDGRSARLSTIIVRPGESAAASSFASSLFRDTVEGRPCAVPVPPETRMALIGVGSCIRNFVALHDADVAPLGDDRAVNFPAGTYAVSEMISVLERATSKHRIGLGRISVEVDPRIQEIVAGWPERIRADRALALGLRGDQGLDAILEEHLESRRAPAGVS